MRKAITAFLLMVALTGLASEAEAFEARAGQRRRERTILACVVVAAAVVLIPTAVGSACASGRCREGTIASAGATDDDEDDGGFSTAPQYETKTAGDSSTTTVHSSLRDEAPSSSSSAPTQSPTSPDFTSPPTLPPTTFETSMNDMMEMQALTTKLQPRVTVVEGRPAHRGIASISNPAGTEWCDGGPTFWVTGHQKIDESPFCLNDGEWVLNNVTYLDSADVLNLDKIDRHYCVTMDVNRDGREDVLCNVGASKGTGEGYNELYITQPDGSLEKIQSGHGLQKHPTMRNRLAVTLRDGLGMKSLVLFTTLGKPRADGKTNVPRMYRNVYTSADNLPYFEEVSGPWTRYLFEASCAVSGDFSRDRRDDLIVCRPDGKALLVTQGPFTTFSEVAVPSAQAAQASGWRNARLADVNRDGIQDVVVLTGSRKSAITYLRVFLGIRSKPHFDFRKPYYEAKLPWLAPDLEVLDVNNDGLVDIYVVQVDSRKGSYCGPGGGTGPNLPPEFRPPVDRARDMLFVGRRDRTRPFLPVTMKHAVPGCGSFVQKWDKRTMLLSGASFSNAGFSMLLEW